MTEVKLAKSRRKHGDGDTHRRCGECTLCCRVMGVEDYEPEPKKPGDLCPDVCSRGCRRYATRPESCRVFACLWVQGGLAKWMRPDKIGIVFVPDDTGGRDALLGHVDLRIGDRWLREPLLVDYFRAISERGLVVALGPTGSGMVTHQFVNGHLMVRPPELDETPDST